MPDGKIRYLTNERRIDNLSQERFLQNRYNDSDKQQEEIKK